MPKRVKRPVEYEDLFDRLVSKEKSGIFETYKDVIIFAAVLGAYHNKSKAFSSSSEPIDYSIFTRRIDNEATILMLSINNEKDINILSDEKSDQRVRILEEYACAGLEIINNKIESMGTTLEAVLNLIYEVEQQEENHELDFTSIITRLVQ